jgi:tryptophan-rich sensory protein
LQQRSRRRVSLPEIGVLGLFLLIALAVAGFGSIVAVNQVDGWYASAPHVTWTPPNWSFGAVWTVLYVLIAVSGWLLWMRHARGPLILSVVQLVVNSVWTPIFFGGYPLIGVAALWIAVGVIVLLDLLVVAAVIASWPASRPAALLLLPYLAWILYASTLNWGDAVAVSLN